MSGVLARMLGAVVVAFTATVVASDAAAVNVERVRTPGGLEAWLVQDHQNPIITVRFAFRGGSALDPVGKEGLAEMVSSLLDEGAGDLDSQAFNRRLEDMAASVRFDAGTDVFGGRLQTLTESHVPAFDLLRQALTTPRFDDAPLARVRGQFLSQLRREAEDASSIGRKAMTKILFPAHPYGRVGTTTPASLGAITVADLRRFMGERLARSNLVIGVVGDIRPEALGPLLDSTFGGLAREAQPWTLPEATPAAAGETLVITKVQPQSTILFAQAGVKRLDPDYYAVEIMNYVLGSGGFTSRLYAEVREKRGLAYSVSTFLQPMEYAGLLRGGAGTANARVAETIDLVRGEWRRMAESGITADELNDAKTYLTGSFPLRFATTENTAAILVSIQLDDLGIDFIDRRNAFVEAVTLDDVRRVARKLLDPSKLAVVVVGQPEGMPATR